MGDDVELIIQLPRGSSVDRQLRAERWASRTRGRIVLEHLPADQEGRLLPQRAGEVVLSVLSPEALPREADNVRQVIRRADRADEAGGPLVVLVEAAAELRDEELAAVLDAAGQTRRIVILRIMAGI